MSRRREAEVVVAPFDRSRLDRAEHLLGLDEENGIQQAADDQERGGGGQEHDHHHPGPVPYFFKASQHSQFLCAEDDLLV